MGDVSSRWREGSSASGVTAAPSCSNVALRLKYYRKAISGKGTFLTLGTNGARRHSRPTRVTSQLRSPDFVMTPRDNALAREWVWTLGDMPCSHAHDSSDFWIGLVPSLVGHSAYFDDAASYFISSFRSYLIQDSVSLQKTYRVGERALRRLRHEVEHSTNESNPEQLLLAVVLHRYAEVS